MQKYIVIGYKKYKCLHPPNLDLLNSKTIKKLPKKTKSKNKSVNCFFSNSKLSFKLFVISISLFLKDKIKPPINNSTTEIGVVKKNQTNL